MVSSLQKNEGDNVWHVSAAFLFKDCELVGARLDACVFLSKTWIMCDYSGSLFQPARIMN